MSIKDTYQVRSKLAGKYECKMNLKAFSLTSFKQLLSMFSKHSIRLYDKRWNLCHLGLILIKC